LVLAVGFVATAVLGYFSLQQHLIGNNIFYIGGQTYPEEYLSISVIMMSVAAFNLLMTWRIPQRISDNKKVLSTVRYLSLLSFGLYLVHPIVMDILNKFCGVTADSPLMPNLPAYVIINAVLTLVVSLGVSALLNATPVLSWLVGKSRSKSA
jgi:surface polysaccharide O-acyltransferase-like enzyme